jgi:excisionase family DNA binding protein
VTDEPIDLDGVREGDALLDEAEQLREASGRETRQLSPDELEDVYMGNGRQTYTVSEAAELTGYHPESIRRHIRNDQLRAAQTGRGNYRIAHGELARWWRDELGGGELFDGASPTSLEALEAEVREAGREAVSVAADPSALDPDNFPLPGDWRWLRSELGRNPTDAERETFREWYLEGLEAARSD